MAPSFRIVATRRLPPACEARLHAAYRFVPGRDDRNYDGAALAELAAGADALVLSPTERLDQAAIAVLPAGIRVIATVSVGYEHIDLAAAAARGIRVTNTPGVLTDATADLALLLILAATRRAGEAERLIRRGEWHGLRPTFMLGSQITGKRLGIIGLGAIGMATAHRARACGMTVAYHNRRPATAAAEIGAEYCPELADLLRMSDVLSLHCPLTPATAGLIDRAALALVPRGTVVINTARGGLIDDDALVEALGSGQVSAAGLDVFANEPAIDPRYGSFEQVVMLPHLGSATLETRTAMGMLAIDNVDAVLAGREPPCAIA